MKKMMIFALVLFLALSVSAEKKKKEFNILGGVSFAFSDLEGVVLDLGAELELSRDFFLQFMINSYLGDQGGNYIYYQSGHVYAPLSIGTQPFGLNFYGLYKVRVSRNSRIFGKAGVNAVFYNPPRYHYSWDYYGGYWDNYYYGYQADYRGPRRSSFGTAFGLGFEHLLTERLGLVVGGTYKMLSDDVFYVSQPEAPPSPRENSRWFKMYLALNYRIRK